MHALRAALLVLEASNARPGALEWVPDLDVKRAETLAGELDLVAVHERVEPTMVRTGRQDVAGHKRVDRSHPLDAAWNFVRHVVGVEVLHHRAIIGQLDLRV